MLNGQQRTAPPGQSWARRWIIYAALGIPDVKLENWRLQITGLVKRELSLTYEQLLRRPQIRIVRDFHCVTKWSIPDVVWEGVSIKQLAEEVGIEPQARFVMFYCLDGYSAPVPLEDALAEDALIALKINGKPLSLEQGYPARPFIPHLYGWKSAKWLTEISFLSSYVDGYWEMYGYHERGNVWREERFKGQEGKHSLRRALGLL